MSSVSPASPISKVNYDVLREIFEHCLPERRFSCFAVSTDKQPNIKVAPMLLCHVCSAWRTVALASARLWSHLCYVLTPVLYISNDMQQDLKFIAREVDFLRWWRKNQGAIPPFLRLATKRRSHKLYCDTELAHGGRDFVLEYAASAQYLEMAPFFWTHMYNRSNAGYAFVPSKLHTLVNRTYNISSTWGHAFFDAQMLFQPCNLRRLSIDFIDGLRIECNIVPLLWSTLSHISVSNIQISLAYWFLLLGGLPQLEWANFDFEEPREHEEGAPHPRIDLPHLSTLYMALWHSVKYFEHVQISALFADVHLPAVRTLSLSWDIRQPQHICCVAAELSAILDSAPAVTTLVLAEQFLEMARPEFAPVDRDAERHVELIWMHAPHVSELRLEAYGFATRMVPMVCDMLFTEGRWLDLQDMTCPVRVVTIASDEVFTERNPIRRKLAEKAPNITFRFTSQLGSEMFENILEEWEEYT